MAKLSLDNVSNVANSSFITTLNNNFNAIEAALENTLSRDGTSPNTMSAGLDMNSQTITNLPAATTSSEPVRKAEFEASFSTISSNVAAAEAAKVAAQAAQSAAETAQTNAQAAESAADGHATDAETAKTAAQTAQTNAEAAANAFDLSGGTTGQAIIKNSATDYDYDWADFSLSSLADTGDVIITSIADGELLRWNGSAWINNTLTEAGIQDILTEGAFVDGDKTKLDGIESLADVTDTANVTSAGALMDSELADITAIKTFQAPDNTTISTFGASIIDDADEASFKASVNLEIGTDVLAYDADVLFADTADQLTAAFTTAIDDDGTQSTGTYTPSVSSGSNAKTIVNGGSFTLAPPSPSTNEQIIVDLFIRNNASAGTITTTGFTQTEGDTFTTTDGHEFDCTIKVWDIGDTEYSRLSVKAMQ